MTLANVIAEARTDGKPALIVAAIPYAQALGVAVGREADGSWLYHLPPRASNIGNATLPALHGGALGGFMEIAGLLQLMMTMRVARIPKVVDFSIDYIRAGLLVDTWCRCEVIREGRKLANLHIEAWQSDRRSPIARARANVLVDE
jgi:acyl-coenzyme A thioesterase PaaI-like protein